jgi:hypothetical protein
MKEVEEQVKVDMYDEDSDQWTLMSEWCTFEHSVCRRLYSYLLSLLSTTDVRLRVQATKQ